MAAGLTGRGHFQFSVRSLLAATAFTAVLFTPLAWIARERQQAMRARDEMLRAREQALQAVIRAERAASETANSTASAIIGSKSEGDLPQTKSSDKSVDPIARLRRENAELRDQVKSLRRQLEMLKDSSSR